MRACVWSVTAAALCLGLWVVVSAAEPAKLPAAANRSYETVVLPLVKQYCLDCHSGADAEQGVRLDKYRTVAAMSEDRATWRKVLGMLRARKMPPEENRRRRKTRSTSAVSAWLEAALGRADRAGACRSGAGDDPASQPCRVHQHRPRPAGRRVQCRRRFPLRRRGLWVRQHRRRAHAPAAADGEVPGRCRANRRQGNRGGQTRIEASDSRRQTGSEILAGGSRRAGPPRLATRAYRRPVSDKELARLLKLAATVWRDQEAG